MVLFFLKTGWILTCFSPTLMLKLSSSCQQALKYPKEYFKAFLYFTNERTEGKWPAQDHRASSRPGWEENLRGSELSFRVRTPTLTLRCFLSDVSAAGAGSSHPNQGMCSQGRTLELCFPGWLAGGHQMKGIPTYPLPGLSPGENVAPSWLLRRGG